MHLQQPHARAIHTHADVTRAADRRGGGPNGQRLFAAQQDARPVDPRESGGEHGLHHGLVRLAPSQFKSVVGRRDRVLRGNHCGFGLSRGRRCNTRRHAQHGACDDKEQIQGDRSLHLSIWLGIII